MATTTRGITYPVVGNTITPLATHFANLATTADTAIGVVADASGRMVGTDAQRTALSGAGLKDGLEWYSQDTDRNWFYNGSAWVTLDGGLYVIVPTSVVNGTVGALGLITPTTAQSSVSVNGVFSSRFRSYRIEFGIKSTAAASIAFRYRNAGSDLTSSSYVNQGINSNAGAVTSASGTIAYAALSAAGSTFFGGDITLNNPATSAKKTGRYSVATETTLFRNGGFYGTGVDASTYDGFTLYLDSNTWDATHSNYIKVYGLA